MSRTHGPRMNRKRTREVVNKLAIPIVKSSGHSIEIHRTVLDPLRGIGNRCTQRWLLYTGGGIVGDSDQVWLSPLMREPRHEHEIRGPYWNKTQLEKALRAWRRGG
jgi:hypothetical protein